MTNTRTLVIAVAAATAVLSATAARGDDPPKVCAAVGCASGVFVDVADAKRDIPAAVAATVCVAKRCRRVRHLGQPIRVQHDSLAHSPVRVRVVLYDKRGKRLLRVSRSVKMRRTQPNGPDCPPICFGRHLRLETAPGRLVAVD
jgi:hypothetical protein